MVRDTGAYPFVFQCFSEPIGVVSSVSEQPIDIRQVAQQCTVINVVANLTSCDEQVERASLAITDCTQLGVHPALGVTDQPSTPPLSTPNLVAVRWASRSYVRCARQPDHPSSGRRRLYRSFASNGCRASCADRRRWGIPHGKPLQLMKMIPLSTSRSLTRDFSCDLGKKGSRRAIWASVSQNRSAMLTARFLNREPRHFREMNGV